MTAPHLRYREFLEGLTPETLDSLPDFVTADVRFVDPFNDVRGVDAMAAVFRHMFESLGDVRFEVERLSFDGEVCLMVWRFSSTLRGKPWTFEGTSVVRFDAAGRVVEQLDHWDAAANFYERLPIIGWLLERIRMRLAVR
ncbi:MAG: nuclear transport factor 2 family protein [Rhodospirillaceae bacterium]